MLVIQNLSLMPNEGKEELIKQCAKRLKLPAGRILHVEILRRSWDCRKKPEIRVIHTVAVKVQGEDKLNLGRLQGVQKYQSSPYTIPAVVSSHRPVVVGFGPAGMFSALVLARAGLRPIILERGDPVDVRTKKVNEYWAGGPLDEESNVQFGEGGAGTFSDGKLNTGIRDPRIEFVLSSLHYFGADSSVCYDAKPHVGTDVLSRIVKNLREEILSLGGEIRFNSRFCDFRCQGDLLCAVEYEKDGEIQVVSTNFAILALGHSAHDTFELLQRKGVAMMAMPFAIGVRIEHPQSLIDHSQYGREALERYQLPPAEYKISYRSPEGKRVHSFCMCPGGKVVAASSRRDGIVTNGMSNSRRNEANANSALLIPLADTPLHPTDSDPLAGMRFLRELEHRAYLLGGKNHRAPMQLVGDFLNGKASSEFGSVIPSYRPGVTPCNLVDLFGAEFCSLLREALQWMDQKIKGFAHPDAVMTAPESRSSSPVRILRDENRNSSVRGLLPCGEGAGYAGGIVSAAVDGIQCAEAILKILTNKESDYVFTDQ